MEKLKKLFGGINLTWTKLIIFAIIAGAYTAVMAILPITNNTSFADITISFEVWILFGILIIMNSKSAIDSALKCFVFFLISQPLVYLIQVPFASMGWGILSYYKNWIVWTLLTIPMGFFGYYMKKDKWWGLIILTPMLLLLGIHYHRFLSGTIYDFPYHLLSCIFCFITLLVYPLAIFENKKVKIAGVIISILIIVAMTVITLIDGYVYNTTLLVNGGESGAIFDDTYNVYLEDSKYGKAFIVYDNGLEDYMINAEFKKAGKTHLILEDKDGNKTVFELEIKNSSYSINKVETAETQTDESKMALSAIKNALKDDEWVKNNLMLKNSVFGDEALDDQELKFKKLGKDRVIVNAFAYDETFGIANTIVSFKDGEVKTFSEPSLEEPMHPGHIGFAVDPVNEIMLSSFMHMGFYETQFYKISEDRAEIFATFSGTENNEDGTILEREDGTPLVKYTITIDGKEESGVMSFDEYEKRINDYSSQFNFEAIDTELTDENVDNIL